ncbi:MAG TPA: hypothetical protein VIF57_08210 [Polyangia bacterium]
MTAALFTVFTAATTLAATSVAHAQTPDGAAAAAEPEPVVTAAPSPAARGTSDDPNIDRGFLLPTAMTQPAGSVTYNNYELLLHGVSYGITDRVQASVTVLSPIVQDMPFLGFASVKARIVSVDRFHLALQGSLGWGHSFDSSDTSRDAYTAGAGAFASYCLREDCSSLASVSATYQAVFPGSFSNRTDMVIYGGSIVHGVGRHFKLLGEVASAAGRGGGSGDLENIDGVLVGYGVRFHTDAIAADVGFMKPVSGSATDGDFIMGLPFVSVSYRWQ